MPVYALLIWLVIGAVIGFVIGAGCAAWVQTRDLPISHGMVTAIATYTLAQAVFIAVRLARGADVRAAGADAWAGNNALGGDMVYAQHLDAEGNRLWGDGIRIDR